jgi:hypothetical protein
MNNIHVLDPGYCSKTHNSGMTGEVREHVDVLRSWMCGSKEKHPLGVISIGVIYATFATKSISACCTVRMCKKYEKRKTPVRGDFHRSYAATFLPRYVLHFAHARCISFSAPHSHFTKRASLSAWCERRLFV